MSQTPRIEFLDALRGWAITMVIANHAGSISEDTGPLRRVTEFGAYGVQLFFVISAYTIFLSYRSSLGRDATPTRNFFIRRLIRIVPVYWAGIVLYTLVFGLASRGWVAGPEAWHYPWHLLLLNIWHPLTQSSVVPGGWSISVEVMFYLTVPLWVKLIQTQRAAAVFAAASMLLGVLGYQLVSGWSHPDVSEKSMHLYHHRLPFNQLACFAMGIWLYFAVRDGLPERLRSPNANAGAWALGIALFLLAWKWPLPGPTGQHLYAASFAVIGLALAAVPLKAIVNSASLFMGKISYSAYLLHFLALERLTHLVPAGTPYRFIFIVAGGFAITIPLAWLSYQWIEQPMTRLGKSWIGRRNGLAAPASA